MEILIYQKKYAPIFPETLKPPNFSHQKNTSSPNTNLGQQGHGCRGHWAIAGTQSRDLNQVQHRHSLPWCFFPKGKPDPRNWWHFLFSFRCLFSDVILKVNRMMIQRRTGMNTQKGKTRLVQSLDVLVCRFFCIGVGNLWILEVLRSF